MENSRFKFRVWDKENNKYKDDLYYEAGDLQVSCVNNIFEEYISDGCIIEQCTGLKDRNGRLIYEGDILGNKDFMSDVALLKYEDEKCCYILERKSIYECFNKWWADRLMVIGNIHENADLLGE